jgi:hypothetical protein
LKSNQIPFNKEKHSSLHHHSNEIPHRIRNLILYHIFNDFSNDLIYGCGLSTAFAHDRVIGSVLGLMIFSEGIRRHSRKTKQILSFYFKVNIYYLETISSLGRKRGLFFPLISTVFLLLGYIIGGIFIEINRRFDTDNLVYIQTEYIYSIVYGALFYTALVTLVRYFRF